MFAQGLVGCEFGACGGDKGSEGLPGFGCGLGADARGGWSRHLGAIASNGVEDGLESQWIVVDISIHKIWPFVLEPRLHT